MPIRLSDEELSEIVEHAISRRWGSNQTRTDYTNPYNVIAYCSERLAQIPFQLGFPKADKETIIRKLNFFNGAIGRTAYLEGKTIESSSYSSFEADGTNQIDIFLEKIGGYKK